jgi:hypothetical protein
MVRTTSMRPAAATTQKSEAPDLLDHVLRMAY